MPQNISARQYEILIAKPDEDSSTWLDVTDACIGEDSFWSVTDEKIGEDGLVRTRGELNLTIPHGEEDIYHTWDNEDRWAIGNKVYVYVRDESGTLREHPRSRLRILSHPSPAFDGKWRINIEIGDILQLRTFREPGSDKSGIEFGIDSTRTDIVDRLLIAAGIDNGLYASSTIPGSIAYPIPKTQRSYVEQSGAVAIGGYSVLWQWKDQVRVRRLNTFPDVRLFKHVVSVDDVTDFELVQGSERPVQIMRCVGSGFDLQDPPEEYTVNTVEYAVKESIVEGGGAALTLSAIKEETARWIDANTWEKTVYEQRARGLLIPESFYDDVLKPVYGEDLIYPSPYNLITGELSTETKYYENTDEGRLIKTEYRSSAARGSYLVEYYTRNPPDAGDSIPSLYGSNPNKRTDIEYFYDKSKDTSTIDESSDPDSSGQVRRIYSTSREPRGKIAALANNWADQTGEDDLAISEISDQEWIKRSQDEWNEIEKVEQSGTTRTGTVAAFLARSRTTNRSTSSRNGNIQPPSAERKKPTKERKEKRYRGVAEFEPIAGADNARRRHTITIDYAASDEQCERLAKIFGDLRMGRHRGMRIATIFRDEWFSYAPLCRIDVEYNEKIYVTLADSVNWTLGANQAVVVADLCTVGYQV